MCHISIIDIASLNNSFLQIPKGSNLLHYLSQPKTSQGVEKDRVFSYRFHICLSRRITEVTDFLQNFVGSPDLGYVSQDSGIVKKRLKVMANNNKAYALASKDYPTVEELREFSMIDDCAGYACLSALNVYLHHHPDAAALYQGFLPFGSGVVEAVRKIEQFEHSSKDNPTYSDHVKLMNLTNAIAASRGTTTIAVNDDLYLIGMKLRQSGQTNPDSAE